MAEETENESSEAEVAVAPSKEKKPSRKILILAIGIIIPLLGAGGWYFSSNMFSSNPNEKALEDQTEETLVDESEVLREAFELRSKDEGFEISQVEICKLMKDEYQGDLGDFTTPKIIGLTRRATDEEIQERCVVFAKVVQRMEDLAHHDRHVFMCPGAQFTLDEVGTYILSPDPKGRGAIEFINGKKNLIRIVPHSHTLLKQWQLYNMGDGCIVIGISSPGVFTF
tara:strand:- start:110 stop:787 length:678 start_codon:yes stop_codon:yes gene_type:complete